MITIRGKIVGAEEISKGSVVIDGGQIVDVVAD